MPRITTATLLLAACTLTPGCAAPSNSSSTTPAPAPAPAAASLPAVAFVGHDSKVSSPRFVLIRDAAAWATLWAEHTATPAGYGALARHAVPAIDFTRFMVVGVFLGSATNTDGCEAHSIAAEVDTLRIRYTLSTFQTSAPPGQRDSGVSTTPFGLWVIDRSDKPVSFELGRRGLKNSPLTFTPVHRITP